MCMMVRRQPSMAHRWRCIHVPMALHSCTDGAAFMYRWRCIHVQSHSIFHSNNQYIHSRTSCILDPFIRNIADLVMAPRSSTREHVDIYRLLELNMRACRRMVERSRALSCRALRAFTISDQNTRICSIPDIVNENGHSQ
jgi:hypothetical protein